MASVKIQDLPNLTRPHYGDTVIVNDNTENVTKKSTLSNLFRCGLSSEPIPLTFVPYNGLSVVNGSGETATITGNFVVLSPYVGYMQITIPSGIKFVNTTSGELPITVETRGITGLNCRGFIGNFNDNTAGIYGAGLVWYGNNTRLTLLHIDNGSKRVFVPATSEYTINQAIDAFGVVRSLSNFTIAVT